MKTICINGVCLANQITGGERYVYEVLKHIDGQMGPGSPVIHLLIPKDMEIHCPLLRNIRTVPIECSKQRKLKLSAVRRYLKQNDGLYCGMMGNMCIQRGSLILIHDIRPLLSPEYDSLTFRARVRLKCLSAKLLAGHIVTVSENSKKEIERTLHLKPDSVSVISPAWDHILEISEDMTIFDRHPELKKGEFFYSLSSLAPHKNFKWVLENAKHSPELTFAIAGKKWTDGETEQTPSNVVYLGYVSDEENKALMTCCKAFIHPSRNEGFGLTPLEALACGAQILVSNCSCMPEIYSTCATLIDPDDFSFDFNKIRICDEAARRALLQKYRWEITARKWLELFETYSGSAKRCGKGM